MCRIDRTWSLGDWLNSSDSTHFLEVTLSYESRVFKQLSLPKREEVIDALLTALLKRNGYVKEFGAGNQEFVNHLADSLGLSVNQRTFSMQTIVRREGRVKKFPAWHRLIFRAADLAARRGLLSHPKDTLKLTGRREWMLTEKGIDKAMRVSRIPISRKQELPVLTYEVQKIKKSLDEARPIRNYSPVDSRKQSREITTQSLLRARGFRHAIVEAYDRRCCVCGLKLISPDAMVWEVEAAHIVPHRFQGKDDIWNGMALCRFHHWTFDVGWFTLRQDYTIEVNSRITAVPRDHGFMGGFDVFRSLLKADRRIYLPQKSSICPHENAISWHRENIFADLTQR
ncbi:MAG: hypothetical protein FJ215_09530 [Ignavibacteria bacterium]|nr:hypothetical protein [Ignavibacteria bacterium]